MLEFVTKLLCTCVILCHHLVISCLPTVLSALPRLNRGRDAAMAGLVCHQGGDAEAKAADIHFRMLFGLEAEEALSDQHLLLWRREIVCALA